MYKILIYLIIILLNTTVFAQNKPADSIYLGVFDKLVAEMERLDGDGLLPRGTRPETWKQTVLKLRTEAKNAKNSTEWGRVMKRLDMTYPNLHAQVTLREEYDLYAQEGRPEISVKFAAERIEKDQKKYRYRISAINTELVSNVSETKRPAIGDHLLEINGRSMDEWGGENFVFCKHPLREQCEANFFVHFRKEFLSWERSQKLRYKLQRNDRTWEVEVPVGKRKSNPQSAGGEGSEPPCGVEKERYPSFDLKYKGYNICLFESPQHPNKAVLRIQSFAYRNMPPQSHIQSLKDEVNHFWENYWKQQSGNVKTLIIDLMENGGGDTPVEWYRIFYQNPFQEQYVEYKKIPELLDKNMRTTLFYNDPARELWFKDIEANGVWGKTPFGAFLPRHPGFCAHLDENCNTDVLFMPRKHAFQGEVRLLVDDWCISSCVGFAWSMKDVLQKRVKVFGFPDSGDTAYARLFLDVYLDPAQSEGYRIESSPRPPRSNQKLPEGAILRQSVSVTRSTDKEGKILSAQPLDVDVWIPRAYRHYDEPWETKVFKSALEFKSELKSGI